MASPHPEPMPDPARRPPVDYEGLTDFLNALAFPARLELLDVLRFPHSVGEIRLAPHRVHEGHNPDRAVARQTVQSHLDKLVEADLVRVREVEEEGRPVRQYVVNPLRLYAYVEELRRLTTMYAGSGPAGDATGTVDQEPRPDRVEGPHLVLVHGVYEGKAFPLTKETADLHGRWTVGRKRDLPVALDYDPFVSLENAVIAESGGAFTVTDVKESKNGTALNWRTLPSGGSEELRSGDVIGVGRSLLSFVEG